MCFETQMPPYEANSKVAIIVKVQGLGQEVKNKGTNEMVFVTRNTHMTI
jgi:hypothetical protein